MNEDEVHLYGHLHSLLSFPVFDTKAGVLGRSVRDISGSVLDAIARQSGVERVANGFRCPPSRVNGGTFTDAMGSTCGPEISIESIADAFAEVSRVAAGQRVLEGREGGRASAIKAKNKEVFDRFAELGAPDPFNPTEELMSKMEMTTIFPTSSAQQRVRSLVSNVGRVADQARQAIQEYRAGRSVDANDYSQQTIWHRRVKAMRPEIADLIVNSSNDELLEIFRNQAVGFHQSVSQNVRVNMPGGNRLDAFLEAGRYLTTHLTKSDHSGPELRVKYERSIGIPDEIEPELRPASGSIMHPSWEKAARQRLEQEGVQVTEHSRSVADKMYEGPVRSYGQVSFTLRPEVADRTGYGRNDSLNTMLLPARMNETDPDKILLAMLSADGKHSDELPAQMFSMLQSHLKGDFSEFNDLDAWSMPNPEVKRSDNAGRGYFEALILGSFGVEDIAEVKAPWEAMSLSEIPETVSPEDVWSGKWAKGEADKIRAEFFSPERLQQLGLSEEEIAYVMGALDGYPFSHDKRKIPMPSFLYTSELADLLKFRVANQRKQAFESKGVKVTVTDLDGTNRFDPQSWGGVEGQDIEELLKQNFFAALPKKIANHRDRERRSEERSQRMREEGKQWFEDDDLIL